MTTDNKAIRVVARNLLEIVVPEELADKVLEALGNSKRHFEARKGVKDELGQHILINVSALDRGALQMAMHNIATELQLSFHDLPGTSN